MYTIDEVRKTLAFCVDTSLSEHRLDHLQHSINLSSYNIRAHEQENYGNWLTSPVHPTIHLVDKMLAHVKTRDKIDTVSVANVQLSPSSA